MHFLTVNPLRVLSVISLICIIVAPWLMASLLFKQDKKTERLIMGLLAVAFPAYVLEIVLLPKKLPNSIYLPGLVADPYVVIFWACVSFTGSVAWHGWRTHRRK